MIGRSFSGDIQQYGKDDRMQCVLLVPILTRNFNLMVIDFVERWVQLAHEFKLQNRISVKCDSLNIPGCTVS